MGAASLWRILGTLQSLLEAHLIKLIGYEERTGEEAFITQKAEECTECAVLGPWRASNHYFTAKSMKRMCKNHESLLWVGGLRVTFFSQFSQLVAIFV